ncbi:PREDICTED: GATA zinc finger domain-containing protein 14-like [Ceratosolen solmsi marchali]|uniref:GATA zinc finger domain-containing protein 14-like n=1 Tax=Ceratosolen solmsi marchali TaxID=326594 RepID=A0AAJ6YEF4_9HYME|nr:PREDICTED: GATA zinc finger domain-containing protein 14-like [Ceratosolen solmsi marchali]
MSRSSAPVLTSLLLLLMLPPLLLLDATIVGAGSETSCSLKSCAILDAELLQDYVSSLNETELNVTYFNTEKELLPFGALPSDWSRLLLLQNRQPKGTPLHDNLLKLSRLLLAAHFESDEHHNWTDDGQSIDSVTTLDNLMVDSYTEFDDQHAPNIKFNSIEKNSDLINSSLDVIREIYNNENQLKDEKFPVNKDDPAATSYYDFLSFTISTTNFNQTFFESTKDNETSRNKSNKTLSIGENEDESFQVTTRTSGNSFIWSSSQLNELEEDNSYWSNSVVTGSSFASSTYSNEQSSEYSSENEAMHERSKEKFAISHLQIKDNKNENRNKNETSSISFSVLMSDGNTDFHRQKNNTVNHTDNFNINITNLLVRFDSDLKKKDSREELLTQSIEDFFADEDDINRNDDSNFVNSTDLVADNVEARRFMSSESLNNSSDRNEIMHDVPIMTDSNKVLVQNTETSIEIYPLNLSNLDNLDKVYTENFTFIESIADELFVTTNSI